MTAVRYFVPATRRKPKRPVSLYTSGGGGRKQSLLSSDKRCTSVYFYCLFIHVSLAALGTQPRALPHEAGALHELHPRALSWPCHQQIARPRHFVVATLSASPSLDHPSRTHTRLCPPAAPSRSRLPATPRGPRARTQSPAVPGFSAPLWCQGGTVPSGSHRLRNAGPDAAQGLGTSDSSTDPRPRGRRLCHSAAPGARRGRAPEAGPVHARSLPHPRPRPPPVALRLRPAAAHVAGPPPGPSCAPPPFRLPVPEAATRGHPRAAPDRAPSPRRGGREVAAGRTCSLRSSGWHWLPCASVSRP